MCHLVEKTIEHGSKVFLLFVDLHKAYDSAGTVVCFAVCLWIWWVLFMMGWLLLYWEVETMHTFEVRNGLCQGCSIAPTLFEKAI